MDSHVEMWRGSPELLLGVVGGRRQGGRHVHRLGAVVQRHQLLSLLFLNTCGTREKGLPGLEVTHK